MGKGTCVPNGVMEWLVSVDDHVVEPPGVWRDRVPARYRDAAPRVVTEKDGTEVWVYQGIKGQTGSAMNATVHRSKEQISLDGLTYAEMAPGCWDPVARLEDMDTAGVLASLNFPSAPRFCGQLFWEGEDKELGLVCAGVERLDERRMVRRRARSLHPADADPAVGPAASGRRGRAHGGQGGTGPGLLGEPDPARPAGHPRRQRLLGPGVGRLQR